MGLDMYLIRKDRNGKETELVYWRKANFIHRYFDRLNPPGIENCKKYRVLKSQAIILLDKCQRVKKHYLSDTKDVFEKYAKKVLPTEEGFFFGETKYGEWYIQDVEYTIKQLLFIIKKWDEITSDGSKIMYYAWW